MNRRSLMIAVTAALVSLGLAIVRRLADLHGARVHIDSELGKGFTVEICFQPK